MHRLHSSVPKIRAALTLLFLALILQRQATADDQNSTIEKKPDFTTLSIENFDNGDSENITINEQVSIESGKAHLSDKGSVSCQFPELSQAKFLLKLDPNLSSIDSEISLSLNFDNSNRFIIKIRPIDRSPSVSLVMTLLRSAEKEGVTELETLRESKLTNVTLEELQIDYSFGLIQVWSQNQRQIIGYYKHASNQIDSFNLMVTNGSVDFDQFKVLVNQTQSPDLTESQKARLSAADEKNKELMSFYRAGKFAEAAECGETVLQIRREILGKRHRDYAASLNNLAALYYNMGEHEKTAPLFLESAEVRKLTLGELHPEYAQSLNNTAALKNMLGDYRSAIPLFREASAIWKETLGSQHYEYATSLHNLARIYTTIGQYAAAESLYQESIEVVKANYGDEHAEYATSLNNLAILYERMGDVDRAEPLYRRCKEIRLATLGEGHPAYASVLNNLGTLYRDQGDFDKALPMLEESLETHRTAYGEKHNSFATSLNNLALLYQQQQKTEAANKLFTQANQIIESNLGSEHPLFAESLINLGNLHDAEGQFDSAEKSFLAALEIRKNVFGDSHPDFAATLFRLAELYFEAGDQERFDQFSKTALQIQRNQLDKNAIAQSARQQIANQEQLRDYLDLRLTNAVNGNTSAREAVEEMWQWKGSVTRRQQAYRSVAQNPKLESFYTDLQTVTQRLSSLAQKVPALPTAKANEEAQLEAKEKREKWQTAFNQLSEKRELLEREIAERSESFRQTGEPLRVAEVQAALPSRTALIDILQYQHKIRTQTGKKTSYQSRFVAFLVQPNDAITLIPLGPAKDLTESINDFRIGFAKANLNASERTLVKGASQNLRDQFWAPIEKHLVEVDTVLVSGDTTINTLPIAAIPSKNRNRFLIEDYRIASLPLAHQLRNLDGVSSPDQRAPQLLVVGNVNYDSEKATTITTPPESLLVQNRAARDFFNTPEQVELALLRSNSRDKFLPLQGFEQELELVQQLYRNYDQNIMALTGPQATKQAFLRGASESTVLHVITHGYFAAETSQETGTKRDGNDSGSDNTNVSLGNLSKNKLVNRFAPGLLSGLAFAGANQTDDSAVPEEDGILRSSEIEVASLNGVELVVLSACETGLGRVANGEGIAGLQRAFQIAGAQSVVASLWKVDDQATVELMKQFYTNLWQKKMPTLDALRDAQITMLNQYDSSTGQIRGLGAKPVPKLTDPNTSPADSDTRNRLPPRYWAAFQLSGDWR